jgi:hypothetical protein
MFINLIGIFIILTNTQKKFNQKLITTTIISSILITIIWIKEYYFPTFDYWELGNRAISTFWHPNYLALYILIIIPFLFSKIYTPLSQWERGWGWGLLIVLSILLLLTKSAWGIIILILYIWKIILNKINKKNIKILYMICTIIIIMISSLYLYKTIWISKLHSFLSRFFIWETTLKIILSDMKTLLIWWWIGTLELVFDTFKSPYLYLFENFWFTADRPHNLLLNFFYHLWIWWLIFIIYLWHKIIKNYQTSPYHDSLILFFIFTIFNFPWITHYLLIILMWATIYKPYSLSLILGKRLGGGLLLITIIWAIFSTTYYREENKTYNNNLYTSKNYIYNKILSENTEKNIIKNIWENQKQNCRTLITLYPSVENYFYCWNILWNQNKILAKQYYQQWLEKIPDLWNKNSKYYQNPLVKYSIDGTRFFSPKYGNMEKILKRVWEK